MIKKYASAELLFHEAEQMGFKPQWETPHGLFSLQHKGKNLYFFYTKLHLNSQLGSWMSQDKYLTHVMLEKHNFPHIPFCYTSQLKDVNRFLDIHQTIIQKPVLGEKSENTHLIENHHEIITKSLDEWIFEKYIQGNEYRCLVLKGKVIAMQEKRLNPTPEHPWRKTFKNLENSEWNKEMVGMSITISQLFQMGLLAVDFMLDQDNKIWILETNSMPGLYSLHHPDEGEPLNVAREILSAVIQAAR